MQLDELVERFETMYNEGISDYFHIEEYESLIDYYKNANTLAIALKVCEYAIEAYTYVIDFFYDAICLTIDLEEYTEAQTILDRGLSIFPNDVELLLCQSNLYALLDEHEKAKEILYALLENGEENDELQYQLGLLFLNYTFQYKSAKQHLLQCISLNSKHTYAYETLVELFDYKDELKEGILFFKELAEEEPINDVIWYHLGLLQERNKQFNDAKHSLEYAHCLDESNEVISFALGRISLSNKDYKDALQHFKKIDENSFAQNLTRDTFFHMGQCYEKLENKNNVIKYYKKAIDKDAMHLPTLFALGGIYYKQKNWFLASKMFEKCTKIDSENAEYWLCSALVQKAIGNLHSSIEMFEKSSVIDYKDEEIWKNWGLLYMEEEYFEEGFATLNSGIDNSPHSSILYYLASVCLIKTGEYQEALHYLENALSLNYENHVVMFDFIKSPELQATLYNIFEKYKNKL